MYGCFYRNGEEWERLNHKFASRIRSPAFVNAMVPVYNELADDMLYNLDEACDKDEPFDAVVMLNDYVAEGIFNNLIIIKKFQT